MPRGPAGAAAGARIGVQADFVAAGREVLRMSALGCRWAFRAAATSGRHGRRRPPGRSPSPGDARKLQRHARCRAPRLRNRRAFRSMRYGAVSVRDLCMLLPPRTTFHLGWVLMPSMPWFWKKRIRVRAGNSAIFPGTSTIPPKPSGTDSVRRNDLRRSAPLEIFAQRGAGSAESSRGACG